MSTRLSLAVLALVIGSATSGLAAEDIRLPDLSIEAEFKQNADTLAFGHGSLWVSRRFDVVRIDAISNQISTIDLSNGSAYQRAPVIGEGAIWVPDVGSNTIFKINPTSNAVVDEITIEMLSYEGSADAGESSIWVITAENLETEVARINESTGELEATISLPASGAGVSYGSGFVWVTSKFSSELYKIDPAKNAVIATIDLDGAPLHVAAGEDAVWVRDERDGSIQRVDVATDVVARIETGLPGGRGNIVIGGDYVWALTESRLEGKIAQIDARTASLVRTYNVGGTGRYISYGSGSLWVGGSSVRRIAPAN